MSAVQPGTSPDPPVPDDARPADDEANDALDPPLDLPVDVPEADAIDQRRAAPPDDDQRDRG